MMKQNSLKILYQMEYYKGDFQSGLTNWYNKLIDKSIDELSVADVSRMIRQDIMKDVAIDRAIELFLIEPFDGEMQDGDLLALLVSCGANAVKNSRVQALIAIIVKLENEFDEFEWANENSRMLFVQNLAGLKQILLRKTL